jgi:hypothetical protein
MPKPRKPSPEDRLQRIVTEARRVQEEREQTYRGQALKLFPPICARCGREFSGKRLRELTVHHKDHDHDHNPPDGSNWELLCLYCHENEHARHQVAEAYAPGRPGGSPGAGEGFKAFADLAAQLEARRKGGEG